MKPFATFAAALLAFAWSARAVTVGLDYTYDNLNGGGFFADHPVARAALEAAAADLSAVLEPQLGAVPTDFFSGSNGATTANIDWRLIVSNPVTDAEVLLNTFAFAANEIRIFVGMRPLQGSAIGLGGPGGARVQISGSGSAAQWVGAVAAPKAIESSSRPIAGPLPLGITAFEAASALATANFSLPYGALMGSVSLDNDTDNNGSPNSLADLEAFWHFDHTTPVEAGKRDFYSVALHEMVHVLGFSASENWEQLASGSTWLGGEAIALHGGSGVNLLDGSGEHLREGLMSPRLSDGAMQEAAMDPTLTIGTRKMLTQMDLAMLRDLGYITIPEPSTGAVLALATLVFAVRRRARWRR